DYFNEQASEYVILKLVDAIERIAPNVKKLEVTTSTCMSDLNAKKGLWDNFNVLINGLSKDTNYTLLDLGEKYSLPTKSISTPSNIAELILSWQDGSSDLIPLLHINRNALQKLTVRNIRSNNLDRLVNDFNGNPVTYPYLLSLCLSGKPNLANDRLENKPTIKTVAPFPRLSKLIIMELVYPFGDDILFRGNTGTLKHLDIMVDKEALHILSKSDSFVKAKFKSLKRIAWRTFIDSINDSDGFVQQNIWAIKITGAAAETLHMYDVDICESFIKQLSSKTQFTNIRILNLSILEITLHDVVHILKGLPKLQILKCGVVERDDIVKAIESAGFLDYLYAKYNGFHRYFQIWHVYYETEISVPYSVLYASIIGIICPSFQGARLPYTYLAEYFEGIKQTMDNKAFVQYSNSLRRLLELNMPGNPYYKRDL
ncbi:hypothetical protein BX070DRAFT_258775, partial [Coemansia spiralis]